MKTSFLTLSILVFTFLSSLSAKASVEVRLAADEFAAAAYLLKPELNSLVLNGTQGSFTPAPSLKFLGVDPEIFSIDMGWVAGVADLRFDQLQAGQASVVFRDGAVEATVKIQDRSKGIRSALGSISFKNVTVVGKVLPVTRANGSQEWVLSSIRLNGSMTGSGVLRSSWVMKQAKSLLVSLLSKQLNRVLRNPRVQAGTEEGLLTWAKFSTAYPARSIVPGSIQMGRSTHDLRFQVE